MALSRIDPANPAAAQGAIDQVMAAVQALRSTVEPVRDAVKQIVAAITTKANGRKWEEALQALQQVMQKMTSIYDDFCAQKAAKEEYDAALPEIENQLGDVAVCEFASLEAESVDIVAAAGGHSVSVVREAPGVKVKDNLLVEFVSKSDQPQPDHPPILSGLEIVRSDAE